MTEDSTFCDYCGQATPEADIEECCGDQLCPDCIWSHISEHEDEDGG